MLASPHTVHSVPEILNSIDLNINVNEIVLITDDVTNRGERTENEDITFTREQETDFTIFRKQQMEI